MYNLYSKLTYVTTSPIQGRNWIGNLRWYARKEQVSEYYNFECISARCGEAHEACIAKNMTEQLFEVHVEETAEEKREYGADYIKTENFFVAFPFYDYVLRVNPHYGLVEWDNLWETGWDDKGGCFFDGASLEEWCSVVSNGDEEAIADGCIIPELINPLDGIQTTPVTKMAYNIMDIIALLEIEGKVCWCEVD